MVENRLHPPRFSGNPFTSQPVPTLQGWSKYAGRPCDSDRQTRHGDDPTGSVTVGPTDDGTHRVILVAQRDTSVSLGMCEFRISPIESDAGSKLGATSWFEEAQRR
jgi:hypothetical protein